MQKTVKGDDLTVKMQFGVCGMIAIGNKPHRTYLAFKTEEDNNGSPNHTKSF